MKLKRFRNFATLLILGLLVCLSSGSAAFAESGEAGDGSQKSDSKPAAPPINAAWEFARANRLASAGAVTRAIPHYEKVLQAAPDTYTQAYFNLAEVYRFKGECKTSTLLYGIYLSRESDEENRADAQKALAECLKGKEAGTLSIAVDPGAPTRLLIGGYVAKTGAGIEKLQLLPGDYSVEVTADEYIPHATTVSIKPGEAVERDVDLEKMLFFGTLKLTVDQKGAEIKIEPKTLDSKRADTQTHHLKSPMDQPLKLATGKYFVEVTAPDFNRWIRNVEISRDNDSEVSIRLTPALPEAIRPK